MSQEGRQRGEGEGVGKGRNERKEGGGRERCNWLINYYY